MLFLLITSTLLLGYMAWIVIASFLWLRQQRHNTTAQQPNVVQHNNVVTPVSDVATGVGDNGDNRFDLVLTKEDAPNGVFHFDVIKK